MRSLVVIAVGLALGVGTAAAVIVTSEPDEPGTLAAGRGSTEPERDNAHEANRRVLTAAQTRRLVRYASALDQCLSRRGVELSPLRKDTRAITIESVEDVGLERLVELTTSCSAPLGDPPQPSSLQAIDARTIVLSVPKQCLLDPKTAVAQP